jgi:hypothetical protein
MDTIKYPYPFLRTVEEKAWDKLCQAHQDYSCTADCKICEAERQVGEESQGG